ncbi:ATG9A protein, partial [Rynchops niger]|nr:ATG9A protein [Rynchops niger]
QFLFVVTFTTFLLCCVDYDVLFANRPLNRSRAATPDPAKVSLPDAVLPAPQCAQRRMSRCRAVPRGSLWCRAVRCRAVPSRAVPRGADAAVSLWQEGVRSYSWQEVQARLMALQRRQQLCVHRRELTELDIHHRILRFQNYTVAMVNKALLPLRFRLPLLGTLVFLTRGLQYNLELLLFWGPAALFQNKWSLRPQCKRAGARRELARRL